MTGTKRNLLVGMGDLNRGRLHQPIKSLILAAVLLSVWMASPAVAQFSGGSGTGVDPYLISTAADMQTLSSNSAHWNKHFKLTADLDLTGVAMTPVGNDTTRFTGTFDGNGFALANLTMPNLPGTSPYGLFSDVDNTVDPKTIFNLGLINPDITGKNSVGALVGILGNGTLSGCYVDGGSVNSDDWQVGGLVGESHGTISDCYTTCAVSGIVHIGGLVGLSRGTISNSYATGAVSGTNEVGGLVGFNAIGTISNSYAAGAVSSIKRFVGGLVGCNSGTISNSFWDTQTSGQLVSDGGVGKTTAQMQTIATFTTAGWDFVDEVANGTDDIWQMCGDGVGYPRLTWEGMVFFFSYGGGNGTVVNPFLISDPNLLQTLSVTSCHWNKHFKLTADLDLTGKSVRPIGGAATPFTGTFDGAGHVISNFNINLASAHRVGLFGMVDGAGAEIRDLGLLNPTVATGTGLFSGGLVGLLKNSLVLGCFVEGGSVGGNNYVGGLVGLNNGGTISSSRASVDVSGTEYVGGLVGIHLNAGMINNSYAMGAIAGDSRVGGLVGQNTGTINSSYSTGAVSGNTDVGGLVGFDDGGTVNASFWDTDTSGQVSSAGGTNKTTAEMQMASTFLSAGWDYVGEVANGTEDIWRMCLDGVGYPRLGWAYVRIGDFGCPDGVAMADYVLFINWWGATNCGEVNGWCGGADFDRSGVVDLLDGVVFFGNWLSGI